MAELYDMHCHLGFFKYPLKAAEYLGAHGIDCLSATVMPGEYARMVNLMEGQSNVRVGLGLHPWWIADGRCDVADLELFERLAPGTAFIGEVGLDFSGGRDASKRFQIEAFERVLSCIDAGSTVSIHVLAAYDEVLDALERSGRAADCSCIFHRFAGPFDRLQRALALGCSFSFNMRGLAAKRGRASAQAIPAGRVLLETDLPSMAGQHLQYADLESQLKAARCELQGIAGADWVEACDTSSTMLLGLQS
jgi:TatD DNase family protein